MLTLNIDRGNESYNTVCVTELDTNQVFIDKTDLIGMRTEYGWVRFTEEEGIVGFNDSEIEEFPEFREVRAVEGEVEINIYV